MCYSPQNYSLQGPGTYKNIDQQSQDDAKDSIEDLELATEWLAYRIFNQPLRHLSWEETKFLLVQCPLCGHARSKFEPESVPLQFISEPEHGATREKGNLSKLLLFTLVQAIAC